ncbi:hypothetical protein BDC45DRAFT_536273 [Circinella umbellata]|nr:hypothetical protein BDC45DRAFT_536273 [Circinella umbellata]
MKSQSPGQMLKAYKKSLSTTTKMTAQKRIAQKLRENHGINIENFPKQHKKPWDKTHNQILVAMRVGCIRYNNWNVIAKRLERTAKACEDKYYRTKHHYIFTSKKHHKKYRRN